MTARFSRRALRQLNEIAAHVAAENPRTAASILARIETLATLIERHPSIGRPTDLNNVRVFRAAPYPYLIFYHADPKDRAGRGVTILRVRHTARKENWREGH
jgi:plasmid stabilization system protein ParE